MHSHSTATRIASGGTSAGGAVSAQPTTDTVNSFWWGQGALESYIAYTPDVSHPSTVNSTALHYGADNHLAYATIADGRPRTVSYVTTTDGQVLDRTELSSAVVNPVSEYYQFNGVQLGDISNNGASNGSGAVDYAQAIASRTAAQGAGPFQNGSTTPTASGAFGDSYQPIDPTSQGSSTTNSTSYVIQAGDTLAGIAAQQWGDASLWYLIADANGLSGGAVLTAGASLTIPAAVANLHNSAATFTVYDPSKAIGSLQPANPPPPAHHNNGCGVVGQIIEVAIAVVVAYETFGLVGSVLGPIAAGAVAAATGSIAAQGVGVATGIQSKFNWSQVGLAAISGGVAGGLSQAFGVVAPSDVAGQIVRTAEANVISQGISVATGLQSKFDWAGVAVAGVIGGVSAAVSGWSALPQQATGQSLHNFQTSLGGQINAAVSGMAGAIAGAATRTLVTGKDFGDNIIAALPDVIGQTVGAAVSGELNANAAPSYGQALVDHFKALDGVSSLAGGELFAGPGAINNEITVTAPRLTHPPQPSLWDRVVSFLGTLFSGGSQSPYTPVPTLSPAAIRRLSAVQTVDYAQRYGYDLNYRAQAGLTGDQAAERAAVAALNGRLGALTSNAAPDGLRLNGISAAHNLLTGAVARGLFNASQDDLPLGVTRAVGPAMAFGGSRPFAGSGRLGYSAEPTVTTSRFVPVAESGAPLSQIEINAQNGAAFQARVSAYGSGSLNNFVEELSIKPNTANGPADFRIRLDGFGADPNTNGFAGLEAKSSETAPLTQNQTPGFELLKNYGGTVVGKAGGPVYPAGTPIPPTDVQIIRPSNLPRGY